MTNMEKLKLAAFGIMAITFGSLAVGLFSKSDLLDQAISEINAAKVDIHAAKGFIGEAKGNVDSAQNILNKMYTHAAKAQKELDELQIKRNRLYGEIGSAIKSSRQNLGALNDSLQSMMNQQQVTLNKLESMGIDTLHILSHKTN